MNTTDYIKSSTFRQAMFSRTSLSKIYPENTIDNSDEKTKIPIPKSIRNAWVEPELESGDGTAAATTNEETDIDALFERSIANNKRLLPRQMQKFPDLLEKPLNERQDTISGILTKQQHIEAFKKLKDTQCFEDQFTSIFETDKQKKE
jgi:hypothetical protein